MNLLTHFRKITILRFVLAGLVLLFSVAGLFADGIASRYPNDVGIENDPQVLLFDGFEGYTTPSQLTTAWDRAGPLVNMRIATEPGNYVGGHKSLEQRLLISSNDTGSAITKFIVPEEPVIFIRAYTKFDPDWTVTSNSHNGPLIAGGPYPGPGHPPPRDGSGFFSFNIQNKNDRAGENQPGYTQVYSYWPYQRGNYGDLWYPDGWVSGGWGLWMLYPSQYPDFSPLPNWQPIRGVWHCYEFMVKINTLGHNDGVVAYWIDGQLAGYFPNLFIRSVDGLKIDTVKLIVGAGASARVNKKWWDNVVIARSYIGPISPPNPISRTAVADFNSDGHPDYVLQNAATRQTAIWSLNNNVFISGAYGPTLVTGWGLRGVADFNRDTHPDYALFNSVTDQTGIWYLSGPTRIGSAYGPTVPGGWELVATGDFNGNGYPDYVLYKASSRQTAIWYLNNNVFVGGAYGPTLPPGWGLRGVADFNGDSHPDYALFNSATRQTAIWYLSGPTFIGSAYGPTPPDGWALVATADFNSNGQPDYLLYKASSRQTAIWYLNNNVFVGGAYGPTLPAGWSLVAP
jgi:FG-GAP-like repeat